MKRKVFQLTLDSTNRVKHVEKKWNSLAKNIATSVIDQFWYIKIQLWEQTV